MTINTHPPLKWVPDLPDFRDHIYQTSGIALPPKVDLRSGCSTVEDQGQLGSCTGNAIVGGLEYLENKNKQTFVDLSRLYVYYQERKIEGTVRSDAGAYIRDGIKAVASVGVCTEVLWPYDITKFKKAPTVKANKDAATRKVSEYLRVTSLDNVRENLASGFPVVFGFTVYDSFFNIGRDGLMPMPAKTEKVQGGHAILAVGYDDSSRRLIIRNSWGALWGDNGYFYMPYDYAGNSNLCDDFWTVRK